MRNYVIVAVVLFHQLLLAAQADVQAQQWGWRGPTGNGIASSGQIIPDSWSEQENVVWVSDVPGRGHSSPIVHAGRVFLTTAKEDQNTQSVICFDLRSGKQLWLKQCHANCSFPRIHPKNTQASPSIAADADRVFAVFCNDDSVHVTCLSLDGQILWQKTIGEWIPQQYQFGFGQSPIFYGGKLLVTSESETDPFIMALDPANGEEVWKIKRPTATSYGTPVVVEFQGQPQMLLSGGKDVSAYDPRTGNELWSTEAAWVVACGTMVWHEGHGLVYASGGYPAKQTLAIRADGSGEVVWENRIKCYEQSLLVVEDCVYGHAEGGVLYCWDAATGQELWVERLAGSESASPVFAGGKIHLTNEAGKTWVIRPSREKFDLVATNQLEDEMFASMAVVNNQILMRVADRDDGRQERLYCIGTK